MPARNYAIMNGARENLHGCQNKLFAVLANAPNLPENSAKKFVKTVRHFLACLHLQNQSSKDVGYFS